MFDRRKGRRTEQAESVPVDQPAESPQDRPVHAGPVAATIGPGITINGEVGGGEDLVIEGRIEGKVDLPDNTLTVGVSGTVSARLSARTLQIHGTAEGDISGSEQVVVSKTGRVLGNIVAPRVTLEDGAQFKGSIDMNPDDATTSKVAVSKKPKARKNSNKIRHAQAVA